MKAVVLMIALVAGLASGAMASAKTVFLATPLGLIAVHSPAGRMVTVRERPNLCVRQYKHWRCR